MKSVKVNWVKIIALLANLKCPNCFDEKVEFYQDSKLNARWKLVPKDTSFMHI